MVGRDTLLTPTAGLPATRNSSPVVLATSGPATGCGSGTLPGHIGTCVCPADGCQVVCCALEPPNANTTQTAKSKCFITILAGAEAKQDELSPLGRDRTLLDKRSHAFPEDA